jgi:hypothetical protein
LLFRGGGNNSEMREEKGERREEKYFKNYISFLLSPFSSLLSITAILFQ